nr:MAG TPA: Nuclear and cytoplasmic polyadenylated RNA-binding, RNP, RBD, poly(U) binding [Caudoviricetes sp.]
MAKADAPVEVVNETTEIVETTVKTKDAKQVIYLGPNSAELGLTTGTVYIDGIPAVVGEDKAMLRLLFAPINKIAEAQQELATEGTAMNTAYLEFKKGGRR